MGQSLECLHSWFDRLHDPRVVELRLEGHAIGAIGEGQGAHWSRTSFLGLRRPAHRPLCYRARELQEYSGREAACMAQSPSTCGVFVCITPLVDRPPRNRELERLVIDAVRASEVGSPARDEAWQVYADWLLSLGEPVGEWLAVSLRADDQSDAAAPVRAALDQIERACSFRLVDLALADLSEVPELARIADLTWERGFITTASIRTREFRAWDSELLEHTPDRLLEAVLRSPSACMLHSVRVDAHSFRVEGSRHSTVAAVLASFEEPLALRVLELGDGSDAVRLNSGMLERVPELVTLRLVSNQAGHKHDELREQLAILSQPGLLPAVTELSLCFALGGDPAAETIAEAPLLDRLRKLRIDHVTDIGAELIIAQRDRFARLERFELRHGELSQPWSRALAAIGCEFG
jgi:hypothetical protein